MEVGGVFLVFRKKEGGLGVDVGGEEEEGEEETEEGMEEGHKGGGRIGKFNFSHFGLDDIN